MLAKRRTIFESDLVDLVNNEKILIENKNRNFSFISVLKSEVLGHTRKSCTKEC